MVIGQLPWHTHVCWFVCLFVDLVGGSFGYNSLSQPNGDLKWWWFRQMCSLFGQTIIKLSQWPNATRKHQTFPMNCSFYRTLYTHARTPSSNVYTVAKVASYFHRKTKTKSSEHNQMHIHTTPYVGVCVCRERLFLLLHIFYGCRSTIRDNFTLGFSECVCVCVHSVFLFRC